MRKKSHKYHIEIETCARSGLMCLAKESEHKNVLERKFMGL